MTQVISNEEQTEKLKTERKIQKALLISKTKRIRRSSKGQFIFVQSGNPKTPNKFYSIFWSDFLMCFCCDCADFTYNCQPGDLCVHILSALFRHEMNMKAQEGN